jgi:hypothetical protein
MKIKYFICGMRPIFCIGDDFRDTFVFDWKTHQFVTDSDYGLRIRCNVQVDELEIVTEEAFREQVKRIREREKQ